MLPRLALAAAAACGLAALPAAAGSPYPGWRGQPASQSPSGLGAPSRRPLDGSLRAPVPAAIWSGLYLGGHLGGGWGSGSAQGLSPSDVDVSGIIAGVHAGYNMTFDRLLLGLEIDGDWSDVDGRRSFSGGFAGSGNVDWLSSLRLRMGLTFDEVLVYATGGIALGGVELRTSGPTGSVADSDTLVGYAIGAGVEWKLAPNLSTRFEVLHYGFGEERLSTVAGPVSFDADVTTVRAGITLHLN